MIPTSPATKSPSTIYYLLAAVTLEVTAQTYGFYWSFPAFASVVYFLAGLAVAIIPMLKWENPKTVMSGRGPKTIARAVMLLIAIWIIWRSSSLFDATPLDFRQADMLPVIETMASRRLSGEVVYAPIQAIWEGMRPIYLPAMWLPYVPAVGFGFDIRWISTIALLLSFFLICFPGSRRSRLRFTRYDQLLFLLPILLLSYYIFGLYSTLITLSEEAVVVGYYVLLAWALHRRRFAVAGLAIALCLLSRYALVFWVPMFLLFLFVYRSRREAYTTAVSLTVSILVLMTLGNAWDQISFFLQLQNSYLEELVDPAKSWSFIAQIEKNPGLVKFLPYEHIDIWHRTLIYGSALIPIVAFRLFKKFRSSLDERFFGLCSLKLSLVYFYNMLSIPYSYLFYPSVFLSLFILLAAFSGKRT